MLIAQILRAVIDKWVCTFCDVVLWRPFLQKFISYIRFVIKDQFPSHAPDRKQTTIQIPGIVGTQPSFVGRL